MPLKLYLDEDVQAELAPALRKRGYNVISVREAGRLSRSDEEQIEFAITQERAMVTYNSEHYVPLHVEYLRERRKHHGIIVSPQISFSDAFRKIRNLLTTLTAEDMVNRLEYLSTWK